MAYDAYGRSRRGNGEPSYFEPSDSHMPAEYSSQYNAEPRDPRDNPPAGHRASSTVGQLNNDKMTTAPDRAEPSGHDVSPELIAAITERVKKELVEHLKQTGNVDEQPKAPPLQRAPSNKSNSTSSPPPTSERSRDVYTPPSPTKPVNVAPQSEPLRSPPSSPLDKPSGVRFSDRTLPTRPGGSRTYSTMELSTIDQKWGRLFDNEGNPTQRLGQFLRGLANHIIEDFPPKRSIVVTPAKMAAYYTSHALDKEIHPLVSIFRAQSNEQISKLYQDLGCQHHLVQEQPTMAPTVPALTPVGFAHWMTIYILAYPDEESKRLEKVVLAMPIDADGQMIDGKPERLPKQISRHLLPEREDRKSRKLIENAISDFFNDLGTSRRRKASITSPSLSRHSSTSQSRPRPVEIHQVRTSPTASKAQPIERERNPYAGAPSVTSESSGNEEVKIERDRQPYTAQPGNGKVYTENSSLNAPPRLGRTNSTSNRTKDLPEVSESRHHRTQSTVSQNYVPPPRAGGRRRDSSPPIRGYSNSTPDDISSIKQGPPLSGFTNQQAFTSSSYPSSSIPPPPPPPVDIRDSRDRRAREERQYSRRGTDEESRLTGEFNSPRDAERWDRFQESRAAETDRSDKPYETRGSVSVDPRDRGSVTLDPRDRGAAYEDWYREPVKPKGAGYDGYTRY